MAALERLNAMLQGQGYTTHFVQGKGTFTGQDVAMLSRMEPNSVGRVEGKGESGGERKQVTKTLVTTIG